MRRPSLFRHALAFLVAIAALALLSESALAALPADLRVMSFNIRTSGADQNTPNSWDNRKTIVIQTIQKYDPDVFGVQECQQNQKTYLNNQLSAYNMVAGNASEGGTDGEFCAIMFKPSRFQKLDQGSFWLSKTPDVVGSIGWDAKLARVATWVKLRDKANPDYTFIFMNTHWDHVGDNARVNSATLMRNQLEDIAGNLPIVITGDFNADQGWTAYRRMRNLDDGDPYRNYADTYRQIHPEDSATVGTAHGFDGIAGDGRIDWILQNDFTTLDANIDRINFSGQYPSDHFPINAILRFNPVPEPAGLTVLCLTTAPLLLSRRRAG